MLLIVLILTIYASWYVIHRINKISDVIYKNKNLVGQLVTCNTNFLANGTGLVRAIVKNKNVYFSAINTSNSYISENSIVQVVSVFNDVLYIEKL